MPPWGRFWRPRRPPADPELRRLVLGREEPITIRPADLLEPQVETARQHLRKLNLDTSDDSVLIQLLFPNLAIDYLREPAPAPRENKRPAAVTLADHPVPAPAPAPAPPPAPPPNSSGAEFEVEVVGEVFNVLVSVPGMVVVPGAGSVA